MYRFTIGRDQGNDVVLNDPTVSSWHAALVIDDTGRPRIEDLQSKNGTFVNKARISGSTPLKPGDRLEFGRCRWDWEAFLSGGGASGAGRSASRAPSASQAVPAASGSKKAMLMGAGIVLAVFAAFAVFTEPGRRLMAPVFGGDSASLGDGKSGKRKIVYDISCLRDSSASDRMIAMGSDMEDELVKSAEPVPLEDEVKVGDEVLESIKNDYEFLSSGPYVNRVRKIMNKLVPLIDSARGFRYTYYVVNSPDVNAFTAGGKVFVFTGILDFADNDDEIACVLGHEIYHNELGHISKKLRKQIAMKKIFGEQGSMFAQMADALFGQSFNQDEETMCDLHGLDLAVKAGFKGCSIISLWERMARDENPNELEKWFRSHPYGKQRATCIRHHIKTNYDKECTQ